MVHVDLFVVELVALKFEFALTMRRPVDVVQLVIAFIFFVWCHDLSCVIQILLTLVVTVVT